MSTPGQRLEVFILHKFKTKKYFCDLMEFHPNSLNKYAGVNAKSVFGSKYQAKLSDMGLNLAWYLTGQGEMLSEDQLHSDNKKSEGVVPFYNIDVSATFVNSLDDITETPEFYVDFKPLNDCTAFLPIYGDSMYPRFTSGEIIAVKLIKNKNTILWGEPYLVITDAEENNMRTLKLLFQHKDEDKVILRASNPNFAGDTVIKKENIINLFIVKGKVARYQI